MATELIVAPNIPHSFLHDLESAYFVLLFQAITNMNHTLPEGDGGNIIHDILDSRRYKKNGGKQKYGFMTQIAILWEYDIPSNKQFISLLRKLHLKLRDRYLQLDGALVTDQPATRLPSFMTPAECTATGFGHDAFIKIFDEELKSSHWPADDQATAQCVLRSNSARFRSMWLEKVKSARG